MIAEGMSGMQIPETAKKREDYGDAD